MGSPTSSEENDPLAIVVETAKNTGRGAVSVRRRRTKKSVASEGDETMRKLTVAACAAGVLATAILGLAGPAAAAVPPAPLARCT